MQMQKRYLNCISEGVNKYLCCEGGVQLWHRSLRTADMLLGLIANLEYRGNIYRKMSKNIDWRGKTKPIMAQLPFLHSTNIPQA